MGQIELPPLEAPRLAMPETDAKFSAEEGEKGLWLSWEPVKAAEKYELTLSGVKTYREFPTGTRVNVSKLAPGAYRWSLIARRGADHQSPPSETRGFVVQESPILPLAWADGRTRTHETFKTDQPVAKLAWQEGPGRPVRWRVRVMRDDHEPTDKDWKYVDEPELSAALDGEGRFRAEAEALDAKGAVIARAPARTMEFEKAKPPPLLKAPELQPAGTSHLRGRADGTADLSWRPLNEAKQYIVHVRSPEGVVVQTVKVDASNASIKGLEKGEFSVSLQAIDERGREGPEGPPRVLKIPEFSSVLPPKLKGVRVK
jgi:hypothetical protein